MSDERKEVVIDIKVLRKLKDREINSFLRSQGMDLHSPMKLRRDFERGVFVYSGWAMDYPRYNVVWPTKLIIKECA